MTEGMLKAERQSKEVKLKPRLSARSRKRVVLPQPLAPVSKMKRTGDSENERG